MYLAGSSSSPSHTIGPATAGASVSGTVLIVALLCRLSIEDLALRILLGMVGSYVAEQTAMVLAVKPVSYSV